MVKSLGKIVPTAALIASMALFFTTPGPVSAMYEEQECQGGGGDCCQCLVFQTEPDTTYLCFPIFASQENPKNGTTWPDQCSGVFCPDEMDCIKGGGGN